MVTDDEIESAKHEVARLKGQSAFTNRDYKGELPSLEHFIANIHWLIVRWDSGYIVMDQAEFLKLSKRKQNQILKLGGKNNVKCKTNP